MEQQALFLLREQIVGAWNRYAEVPQILLQEGQKITKFIAELPVCYCI